MSTKYNYDTPAIKNICDKLYLSDTVIVLSRILNITCDTCGFLVELRPESNGILFEWYGYTIKVYADSIEVIAKPTTRKEAWVYMITAVEQLIKSNEITGTIKEDPLTGVLLVRGLSTRNCSIYSSVLLSIMIGQYGKVIPELIVLDLFAIHTGLIDRNTVAINGNKSVLWYLLYGRDGNAIIDTELVNKDIIEFVLNKEALDFITPNTKATLKSHGIKVTVDEATGKVTLIPIADNPPVELSIF